MITLHTHNNYLQFNIDLKCVNICSLILLVTNLVFAAAGCRFTFQHENGKHYIHHIYLHMTFKYQKCNFTDVNDLAHTNNYKTHYMIII